LGVGAEPLLKFTNAPLDRAVEPEVMTQATFKLTKAGQSVLAGKADFIKLNGIDEWLGGVHLKGDTDMWRWHDPVGRLALVKNRVDAG
jgi:hypothetical protein